MRGITTTLVNGATMFFVGAWDYHVFCLMRVVAMAFVGVWDCHNSSLVHGVYHGFMCVSLSRLYVRIIFICVCLQLYVRRFITALCVGLYPIVYMLERSFVCLSFSLYKYL